MTEIADANRRQAWGENPGLMVRELFGVEPDPWQDEALMAFPKSPRMCLRACKGPGKTSVLSWLGWNYLLTRDHPVIGATSTTGANLKANLWTEMARWRAKSPLLMHFFEQTKTTIFHREHPETWKMEARTWPKDADETTTGSALAGLHAPYVMWLLDESGDYPDSIMPTVEAIFSGNPIEAHIVQAGNPLMLSGPLYRACTIARKLWRVIEITGDPDDPKRSPRIPIEHAREQIEQYGRDDPWVLVNIFGRFPPASINALIGPDAVADAMKRYYREHEIAGASRVMGLDVARQGDDSSVLARRQGLQMFPLTVWRNLDSTQGAGAVSRIWADWKADAAFVDMTGGFGAGWYDQLIQLKRTPIGVEFSGRAHDHARYFNKRTEMAFDLVAWIKRGGALPNSPEMLAALTQTTYSFKGDKMILEPKDDVKVKLRRSPDEMDAAMLTFAEPVVPQATARARPAVNSEYKPFAELDRAVESSYRADGFDPFRQG